MSVDWCCEEGLVCGHNTGMSNAISPVKQPEQKAVVMPRCVPLPFDKEGQWEMEKKQVFLCSTCQGLFSYVKFMFFCFVLFFEAAKQKCNSQPGISEVKVVGLEPSCGWSLDALSFPLSVSREWRPSAQSRSSCSCPLLAPTGKDHVPGCWTALSWGSASCA